MMDRYVLLAPAGSHRHWAACFASSLAILSILFFATAGHAAPSLIGTSPSSEASSSSSTRRTFYDTLNSLHWAFYYNGTAIEYSVSADTTNWSSVGTLPYATSKFTLTHKVISGTSYVFLVSEANSHDIVLRRGILTANSVSFDAEITVLNGGSSDDQYLKPSVALDGNNYVWVSAVNDYSDEQIEHRRAVVNRSANAASGDLSGFGSATVVGGPSNSLQDLVILPQAGAEMYLLSNAENGNVVGYKFDGSVWSAANTGNDLSWFHFPQGLDYDVHSIAISGSDVYIGGSFTDAGGNPAADHIARWDGTSWNALGSGLNGQVFSIVVSGTDIYVGGNFTNAGGNANADYIARWDGSSWHPLGTALSGTVYAIAVSGSDLFAAGNFLDAGGDVNADRIARWNGSAWSALGTGLNSSVRAVAVSGGGDVYAGGYFTDAGGDLNGDYVARWDGSSWNALGTGLSTTVNAIAVSGTDVYVGGAFTNAGGIAAADLIARWDGSAWNALGFGLNNIVNDIVVSGSDIYVAGLFTNAGGNPDANWVARWDGSTWNALGSGSGINYRTIAIAVAGSEVYAGGQFQNSGANNNADFLARFDGSSWYAVGLGSLNGNIAYTTVFAIAISGSDVYVGGDFRNAGGNRSADNIARWDGSNWNALGSGVNNDVYAIAVSGSDVFVGGQFTDAGGNTNADRIARWDGSSWNSLGTGLNNFVLAIAVSGTDVYVGGGFTDAGGDLNADRIARWDGSDWNALGLGLGNTVRALGVSGGDVYAGGNFLDAGGDVNADRIARWDGTAWNALATGLNNTVYAIAVSGSDVYAGGLFSNVGGSNTNYIGRWDGFVWNPLGTGLTTNPYTIQVSGSDVYVGGTFGNAGGNPNADFIARWDGSSWNALGTGLDNNVRAIAVSGTDVYAAGTFIGYLARYGMVVAADVGTSAQISATNDAAGNIHLLYSNSAAGLYYKEFANSSSTWQAAVPLSADAIADASISINPCQRSLSAVWSATGSILYKTADFPFLAADWDPAAATLYNTGTNASVSAQAPYAPGGALVTWTNGSGSPYNLYAEQILLNSSSALPFQAGVPGPLSPNIPNTEFANEITFPESAKYADLCTIALPASSTDPSALVQNTPAYLYTDPASFGHSPNPASARSISWTFTVDSPTSGGCIQLRRFGSEDGRIQLIRNGATTVYSAVTNGNGERIALSYEAASLGSLAAGNYELRHSYEGAGSDNGFFIDMMAMFDTDACGVIQSVGLSEAAQGAILREKFAQIGVIDQYSETNPERYSDEFLSTPGYTPVFNYNVSTDPDDERIAPAVPAVLSPGPVSGKNAAGELRLQYNSAQTFPEGAVFTLTWYGDSSTSAAIYHDGQYLTTARLNSGPSLVQTNVLIRNLTVGTHEIRIVAKSGTLAFDAMYILDQRTDLDGDGLSYADELRLGTDPSKRDTDGDGVDDGIEVAMGSNPLNAASVFRTQGQNFTTGVNSNIGMMNIQEIRNVGATRQPVWVSLYDMTGRHQDTQQIDIAGNGQFDVLAHGLGGFHSNMIGSIAVDHIASAGQIQTQMVYYLPSQHRSRAFEFAYANASFALSGVQHVPINTYYPNFGSLNPQGQTYNWVEVTHVPAPGSSSSSPHRGVLEIHDNDGRLRGSVELTLSDYGRQDIDVHSLVGKDAVGFATWHPEDNQTYSVKNSRYYWDESKNEFLSAFQLGAQQGTTEQVVVPIETDATITIIEVGSASEQDNQVQLLLYDKFGALAAEKNITLSRYSSNHTITTEYPELVDAGLGLALVKGTYPVLVTAMQYSTDTARNVYAVSGVPAIEPLARIENGNYQLNASYNSFLNQDCSLVVLNGNSTAISPQVTLYSQGGEIIAEQRLILNGHGAEKWNPCRHVPADTYGNAKITLDRSANPAARPPIAWLYREGDKYRFPTAAQ